MSSLTKLSLATILQVKGGVPERMLAVVLNRIANDLETAPDISEARVATIEMKFKPISERGQLEEVDVQFLINGKLPKRGTGLRMVVRSDAQNQRHLMFNVDAQDNPNQQIIPGMETPAAISPAMAMAAPPTTQQLADGLQISVVDAERITSGDLDEDDIDDEDDSELDDEEDDDHSDLD